MNESSALMSAGIGALFGMLPAAFGWWITHRANLQREKINKLRDLRIGYLIEAYRRLENCANRRNLTDDEERKFESAIADIRLLGEEKELVALEKYTQDVRESGTIGNISPLLETLREELRSELGRSKDPRKPSHFRFAPKKP